MAKFWEAKNGLMMELGNKEKLVMETNKLFRIKKTKEEVSSNELFRIKDKKIGVNRDGKRKKL